MSLSFKERKRPTDAEIKDYYKLLQADPRSRIFAPLAEALAQRDMLEDAIKICEHGMKYHQDFSDGHITYARVLHLANQKDEALEHIRQALALDNRNPDAYLAAAEIFMEMDLIKAACEACLRIMEMEPQNRQANELLTLINNRSQLPDSQKPQDFQSPSGTVPSQRRQAKADPALNNALAGLFEELEEEGSQKIEQNENPFRALSSGSQSGHPAQALEEFESNEHDQEETREVEFKLRQMIDQVRPKIEQPRSSALPSKDERKDKTQPQINPHNPAQQSKKPQTDPIPGRGSQPTQKGLQRIAYVQNIIEQYSPDNTRQGQELDESLDCLGRTRSITSALGMIGILVGLVILIIALSSGTFRQAANTLNQTGQPATPAVGSPTNQIPAKDEPPSSQPSLIPETQNQQESSAQNQQEPSTEQTSGQSADTTEKGKKRKDKRRLRKRAKKNLVKKRLRRRKRSDRLRKKTLWQRKRRDSSRHFTRSRVRARHIREWALVVVAVLFSICASVGQVSLAEVQVSWSPVELDVEGNPKTISHYLLYYGRHPRPKTIDHPADVLFRYENVINIGQVVDYRIRAIEKGYLWYFSVAAVDREGSLSNYSDEVELPIPDEDGQIASAETTKTQKPSAVDIQTHSTQHCASTNSASLMLLPILLAVFLLRRVNRLIRFDP